MSSLILHLCISEVLRQKYNYSNNFLVGAIAPDIYKKYTNNRDETHYIEIIHDRDSFKKLPNIQRFLNDNKFEDFEFYLGYLVHLIQDKIWFDKHIPMYAKKINEQEVIYVNDGRKHLNSEFSKEIYMDYAFIDKLILSKSSIDLSKIKEDSKKYFNNNDISKIIDDEIKLYPIIKDRENKFLTGIVAENYFNQCLEECNKIIEEYINKL